jgi:hypothetical protein
MGNVAVSSGLPEKRFLRLQGFFQTLVDCDILLTAIDSSNEPKLQGIHSSGQDFKGIRAMVHQIEFCEYTDRPLPHRVNLSSQFKSFRVDKIDIGGCHSEDNTAIRTRTNLNAPIGLCDILHDERANLLLDIGGLITDRDLCQTGQVHQRKVQNIGTENLQMDGKTVDALVEASDTSRFRLDFPPDSIKVGETVAGIVEKFGPFGFEGSVLRVIGGGPDVDELEDEGATGDDARATG